MADPRTNPGEHDKPAFQPGTATPEDPRQNAPIHDPPIDPEHDDVERVNPVRQADDVERDGGTRGVEAADPSPDRVLFDENRSVG